MARPTPPHPKISTGGSRVMLLPRQQTPQGADACTIAEGGGRLKWPAGCHFPLRHLFQCLRLNSGDDLIPPPYLWVNIKVSLSHTAVHPTTPPETFFSPHSFVCCEKYPWKLLCRGRKSKPTDPPHERKFRHRPDDIIATTELSHFSQLFHVFPDRACPAARLEGPWPWYNLHRGRLKWRLSEEVRLEDLEPRRNGVKVTSAWCVWTGQRSSLQCTGA